MSKLIPLAVAAIAIALYFSCPCCDRFDPGSIVDKRVLVTGASSGIGEQLAYQYCKLGARVVIAARRRERLEQVATRCRELGGHQVEAVPADLGKAEDRIAVVKAVRDKLGGLDHLVLNHAVISFGKWLGSAQNVTNLLRELDINFVSFVDLASQTLDMLTESGGHLGVVSSMAGKMAFPYAASYVADKFALQGFFRTLALEQELRGTGVSVTLCVIGPVDTEIAKNTMTEEQMKKTREAMIFSVVATAEDTATAILHGVATRQPEIYYGRIAAIMTYLHKIFPMCMESITAKYGTIDLS